MTQIQRYRKKQCTKYGLIVLVLATYRKCKCVLSNVIEGRQKKFHRRCKIFNNLVGTVCTTVQFYIDQSFEFPLGFFLMTVKNGDEKF